MSLLKIQCNLNGYTSNIFIYMQSIWLTLYITVKTVSIVWDTHIFSVCSVFWIGSAFIFRRLVVIIFKDAYNFYSEIQMVLGLFMVVPTNLKNKNTKNYLLV
jgi:hypothetical protein